MKKKQIVLSLGTILGGIALFHTSADAASTSVQVKTGDTLWSIATKYQTSVQNLKTQNNLKSDVIHVGQTLVISSSASKPAEPAKPVD
ncbi:LysM peptidoglycan-binding domain-containing protein, partial [Escherichia coli]|nr:LysM peptidoglycan-binding domain-containing protein [Escherichia coli]